MLKRMVAFSMALFALALPAAVVHVYEQTEAGGVITKIDGSPVAWDGSKSSVLAASPENSLAMQKLAETVLR